MIVESVSEDDVSEATILAVAGAAVDPQHEPKSGVFVLKRTSDFVSQSSVLKD